MRIACLHTVASNIAAFEAAGAALGLPPGSLRHAVRADLLAEAGRQGGLTPEITAETGAALLALCAGADAVLLTCSTLGPAVAMQAPVPVLRVDAALAQAAVRRGGRVVVLCAAETTLGPTGALFAAAAQGSAASIDMRLVPGAWAAFEAGDEAGYFALIAAAARRARDEGASCVALAQASMAGAAALVEPHPPLTSPGVGLAAAMAAAR